ncbi:unnamed protein product [Moneuplotes crassus]|uniref:Uncharacterized protein n=1 Tax=Euplotes crassus TaxID=5936 RepID=A0AAD1XY57_EUPCR|nr:unnamed protein product [Moneuplotes crassus]
MGSAISARFQLAGSSSAFFFNVVQDPQGGFLYFVGYYAIGANPIQTIIYKSDFNLSPLKVMTYDLHCAYISFAISQDGSFMYVLDRRSNRVIEIEITRDLGVTREFSVNPSGAMNSIVNAGIDTYLYFNIETSSTIETCRWDRSTSGLTCLGFGILRHVTLVALSNNLLFMGSIDTAFKDYYLIAYNFTDPSNLAWKKVIPCPGSSCSNTISSSILSRDEQSIFLMVIYKNHFLFYKINAADGSPQNPGFLLADNNAFNSYSIEEFNDFVAVQITSDSLDNYKKLVLFDIDNANVLKEYNSFNSQSFGIGRILYQGTEFMYHCGTNQANNTFFFARTPINNINQLPEFQEDPVTFVQITTIFQISSTTSDPSLTSNPRTATILSSSAISTLDITTSINPTSQIYVALWNADHVESFQSNTLAKVNFNWPCAQIDNYTVISFIIVQTGANVTPDWVQLNAGSNELYLNKTPKLNITETFYFTLQISFNSEVHLKKFEITVELCTIPGCEICQLGNTSQCQVWINKDSDGQESIYQTSSEIQRAKDTASALMIASIVMAAASSALSFSSISSIMSIINTMQLVILLPMIPDYFSEKVQDLLNGMEFTMLSFDFIRARDIPFVNAIKKWVSYSQSNEYLNSLGLRSGSSVVNYLSLMATIILVGLAHICIFLCRKCVDDHKHKRCGKLLDTLFQFFTFNIYIRIFIQAFLFTNLSIFSELYAVNLKTTVTKVSFGLCIMFALCTSVLFILSFIVYASSFPQINYEKYQICIEYFNGVKLGKFSKLYSSIFMLLRLVLCSIIIFGRSRESFQRAISFSLVNILYGSYLLIVRPFEKSQDNMIEMVNQILFCSLTVPLSWLNTKSDWSSFYESYYISIVMTASVICSIISFVFLIKEIISFIKNRKKTKPPKNIKPKKTIATKKRAKRKTRPCKLSTKIHLKHLQKHRRACSPTPSHSKTLQTQSHPPFHPLVQKIAQIP